MELLGAFLGAAFAFAFFLAGQAVLQSYHRRMQHYNALVALERSLNLQLDEAHNVAQQIAQMPGPVSQGQLLISLPRPMLPSDDLFLELLDVDLVNALINYRISVSRLNSDLNNVRSAYESIKNLMLSGSITRDAYIDNAQFVVSKYGELGSALMKFESQVIDLLVVIRLRLRERRPASFRLIAGLTAVKSQELPDALVERERSALQGEMDAASNPLRAG